jgi:hypothetical protein
MTKTNFENRPWRYIPSCFHRTECIVCRTVSKSGMPAWITQIYRDPVFCCPWCYRARLSKEG